MIPEVGPILELTTEGDVNVKEGDSFTVTCSVKGGYPVPTIEWRREGGSSFSSRIMISDNLMVLPSLTLSITKVELADFGSYRCVGRNSVGVGAHVVNIKRSKYLLRKI